MFKHEFVDFGDNDLPRETVGGMRFYRVGDQLLPSVTTVMKIHTDEAIAKWREKVGDKEADRIGQQASSQGNVVHNLAEQYVLNEEPDTYKKSFIHVEMFNSLKHVLDAHVGTVYGTEKRLYSTTLGVAGTGDLFAEWDGVPSVIDYKTSSKEKREDWIQHYFEQCALYSFMAFERAQLHLPQIVVVVVNSNTAEVQVFKKRARDYLDGAIDTIVKFNNTISGQ